MSGLGAPYWNPEATGAIIGITRGTESGHIALAALESIALRTREIIIEMERFDNDQIQSDRRKQELDDLISTTNLQLKREIQIFKLLIVRILKK